MSAPDMDLFRQRLRDTRKARKLSLQEVAAASGFTKSHVWEMENGRARNPTVRAVWSLSGALGVSPAYLLGLDPDRNDLDPLAHQIAAIINTELARRS
jgi:transcriptional regulator with XRE-family HTH domain